MASFASGFVVGQAIGFGGASGGGGGGLPPGDATIWETVANVGALPVSADLRDGDLCYVTSALAWYRYDLGSTTWQWARALWDVTVDGEKYNAIPTTGVYSAAIANWYGASVAGTLRRSGSAWVYSQSIAGGLTPTPLISMPDILPSPTTPGFQTEMSY